MRSIWKKTLAMAVVTPAMLLTMAAPPVTAAPGDSPSTTAASTNLALASAGATVTSSGDESTSNHLTASATDGDPTTRWSSNHSDTAQLTVKLAKPVAIEKVVILWETACAAKYKLQVSTDGTTFVDATDVISRADCSPATPDAQTIKAELAGNKYQYVRMQGVDRTPVGGTKWGISLFEMEVWGVPALLGKNVALASAGASVTASGQEVPSQWGPALVIDGDSDASKPKSQQSRWSSNTADDAHITVKLAAPTVIDHVTIGWETACAAKYKLQVSTDGITFVDATDAIAPTCDARDTQKLNPALASNEYQYVRMQGIDRTPIGGVKYGMSMWEFEVWDGPEATTTAPAESINLIPLPVNLEAPDEAPFTLGAGSRIVANNADTAATAEYLANIFRASTGLALPVVQGTTGDADDVVILQTPGDIPNLGDQLQSEAYTLSVDAVTGAKITSPTSDGVFSGVQTLRQLFPAFIESKQKVIANWSAPAVEISDAPRFDKRGMMLDVARDFKRPDEVKDIIDSLVPFKISTLHIHLADDQGWRIEITNDNKVEGDAIDYSQLTDKGGKSAVSDPGLGFQDELGHTGFFTQAEFKDIVAYAASRHIEIIPEIDVPGHTSAILHSIPEMNTANTKPGVDEWGVVPADGTKNVGHSSLDVDSPQTWMFINHVFKQIADMSPGEYMHMGGDETHVTSNADFTKFITKTVEIVHSLGKKPIGWNEVAVAGLTPNDGIQYWTGGTSATLDAIKTKGARLMVSNGSTSYIDMKYHSKTPIGLTWAGTGDFPKYYDWNPAGTVKDGGANLPDSVILGVEAAQWSETIRGGTQAEFMAFPRVVSFAEIGWTPQAQRNVTDFKDRMASMGQRMLVNDTNFYDGNQAKWRASMAGLPVAVAPGKSLTLDVGQFAAPGTKASADGSTIAVDSVDDTDSASASSIVGDLGVTVDWGDGSVPTPAAFKAEVERHSLGAGSLYQLQGTHNYASAGNYTGTLTASNGATATFTVAVAAGTADPAAPDVWDSSQTPTLATSNETINAGYRAATTLTGFEPGRYVVLTLDGKRVGSVLPDAEGKLSFQLPVYPNNYSGTFDVVGTQESSAGTRTATDTIKVFSKLVPLLNKIPQTQISIESVTSEELAGEPAPSGSAAALLDGQPNTYWHTKWQGTAGEFPHSVVFDLGESFEVTGFEYTQRQSNSNGKIKDYELYVSDSPTDFGDKVASGSFMDLGRPQVIAIEGGKDGRYVKLVGLNSIAGNAFGGGAEVNIGGTVPGTTEPTDEPTTDPTGEPTTDPTDEPTTDPTDEPTTDPTGEPTTDPTGEPTTDPTGEPTTEPTTDPTNSDSPTQTTPGASDNASDTKPSQTQAPVSNTDDLATTGSGTAPLLLGGLVLLLAGALALVTRRKKSSSHV